MPSCSVMQNAGIYVSKTTVQLNEKNMQEGGQKFLNLNKICCFDEIHSISLSRDARYNNRLEVVWEYYSPFQPSIQSVYLSLCTCIGTKRECPGNCTSITVYPDYFFSCILNTWIILNFSVFFIILFKWFWAKALDILKSAIF